MKLPAAKMVFWSWMAAGVLSASPLAGPSAAAPVASDSVAAALARLADDSFAVRQAATRDLWAMGEQAVAGLQEAAAGRDPEAAGRARDLLRKIQLGILPDSSPKIVDLVLRYDRSGIDERRSVINELRKAAAWRQILKLYALEKDDESLAMLEDATRGVAVEAARSCLASDPPDLRGAFSFLAMARPEPAEYMAMAALHRATGTMDEELRKSAADERADGDLWRYALLAVAGRPAEAAAAAGQAGLPIHAARLELLAGDPRPWLKAAPAPPQAIPSPGLPAYREFVARRWDGKPVPAEMERRFRRLARVVGDEDEQLKSLRLLFLIGDHAEAEKRLLAIDPRAAFYYFESAERIEEALQALGLDPSQPDFAGWAMKRFRVLIDDPDSEEHELTELSLLGYFLERRGLGEELEKAFAPPLAELAKSDQESFTRVATRLFAGPFDTLRLPTVGPVIQAAAVFAGDDEVRWMQIVENLFDGQERPDRLWNWLGRVEPARGLRERLELLARIYGLLPDPADERAAFFDKSWQGIGKADPAERGGLLELLVDLADQTGDAPNFLRGMAVLEKDHGQAAAQRFKGVHLAAAGRWDEAAAEWMKMVERQPVDPAYRAYAAASYRRAGNESAAVEQERRAELLALGETIAQFQCAEAFGAAGDFARAATWWRRAGLECTNQSSAFQAVVLRLGEQAHADADWKTAAAMSEAQALQQAQSGSESYRLPVAYAASSTLRLRIDANLARAFSRLGRDRGRALQEIERYAAFPYADLALADSFFAPMRQAGLVKLHDQAFERLWLPLTRRIARYPDADNTRNSAAWLASRAKRRLDEAERYLAGALETYPRQAAYLDTMAEVHFARGDRKRALEFSTRALREESGDLQLIRQHERFKSGPFPPK
jgi:tetratricopeptide (TPR) repeat protein